MSAKPALTAKYVCSQKRRPVARRFRLPPRRRPASRAPLRASSAFRRVVLPIGALPAQYLPVLAAPTCRLLLCEVLRADLRLRAQPRQRPRANRQQLWIFVGAEWRSMFVAVAIRRTRPI